MNERHNTDIVIMSKEPNLPIFLVSGIVGFVIIVLFVVFYVIACISIERTKNEVIRIRELLENINKVEVARYKKEFNVSEVKDSNIKTDES